MKLESYLALKTACIITQLEKSNSIPNLYGALQRAQIDTIFTLFSLTPVPTIVTSFTFLGKYAQSFCFVDNAEELRLLFYVKGGELVEAYFDNSELARRVIKLRNMEQFDCQHLCANRFGDFCMAGGMCVVVGRLNVSPLRVSKMSFTHQCTICQNNDCFDVGSGRFVYSIMFSQGDIRRVRATPFQAIVQRVVSSANLTHVICDGGAVITMRGALVLDSQTITDYDFTAGQQIKVDSAGIRMCISSANGCGGCIAVDLRQHTECVHFNSDAVQLACEFAGDALILAEGHCLKVYSLAE